jgi:hypothetical protein
VLLPEFGLLVKRNRVERFEELIHVLGVGEVELPFLECAVEVPRLALGQCRQRNREHRLLLVAAVQPQLLAVRQHAILRPEVVHVVKQL